MRRLVCTVALALLATLASVHGGGANSGWCRTDPVITLDGHVASVWVTTAVFPNWAPGSVASIVVEIPTNVTPNLVWIDPNHGFETFTVSFQTNQWLKSLPHRIEVRISVFTANPLAPGTGAGVEFAENAEGYPIAASRYGTIGTTLVLNTDLRF
jgi:hypothetical protein